MNLLLAANPFDNPWAAAVVLIVGVLVNWLAKRFNDRHAAPPREPEAAPPADGRTSTEFNLEDALRRLMGEERLAPGRPPPVTSDPARSDMATEIAPSEMARQSDSQHSGSAPPVSPSMTATPQTESIGGVAVVVEAARRFEQLREPGGHHGNVSGHSSAPQASRAAMRTTSPWRKPRYARRAWVASMVFGPPNSLRH